MRATDASCTCTFTITDTRGSRSLEREPEDTSSGETSMVGWACDERGVKLTAADLAQEAAGAALRGDWTVVGVATRELP